jgi:NTE family protein
VRADGVFEGGGVKAVGLLGALERAESHGIEWERVGGTSAGAIVAALVAAGYSGRELSRLVKDFDFRRFQDRDLLDRVPMLGPALSLGFEAGVYEGDELERWLAGLLEDRDIQTFGDLIWTDPDSGEEEYRLQVVAADVSQSRLLVLPEDIAQYGDEPDELSVARAVRMSASVPLYFEPQTLKDPTGVRSYIVDGGILQNFPVWLFDRPDAEAPRWPTVGFKLVGDPVAPGQVKHPIRGPLSLMGAVFLTMLEAQDQVTLRDQDFVRTVTIPTAGVTTFDFDLSAARRDALYRSGQEAADKFFAIWDFEEYVQKFRQGRQPSRRRRLWGDES